MPFGVSAPVTVALRDATALPIPKVALRLDIVRINVQLAFATFLAADGWHYLNEKWVKIA